MLDKKSLSEQDICTKFITPAIEKAGWDRNTQFLQEVSFTDGKIYVRGKLHSRGKAKRADYILYYKPNIPIAIVEAKDNKHSIGDGLQQALDYSHILDIPFVFSSNGDGFIFHDKTAAGETIETEIDNDSFPSPELLWQKYKQYKGINEEYNKYFFTILDFRNSTDHFADQDFDGDPIRVKPVSEDEDLSTILDEEEADESVIIDEISEEEITFFNY